MYRDRLRSLAQVQIDPPHGIPRTPGASTACGFPCGSASAREAKIGRKFEAPAAPFAPKRRVLVHHPGLSAELFRRPIEHALELTGCGSVASAASIANVMISMVSGGKDAFEKSFTPSIPSNFGADFPRFDPSPVLVSTQAAAWATRWIARSERWTAFRLFRRGPRRHERGRCEHHPDERDSGERDLA